MSRLIEPPPPPADAELVLMDMDLRAGRVAATVKLVDRPPDALLFHAETGAVTTRIFLGHAQALAETLPARRHMINLCRDRYAFAVALAAAVLRGQPCLLTGDRSEAALAALAARYEDCYVAADIDPPVCLPTITVRPAGAASDDNPAIPADRLAAIVFTSGSTGIPSAHEKDWGTLSGRSRAAAAQFALDPALPASVIGTVPPQHMYGFETTVLLPLHAPASSWCKAAFFPVDIRAAAEAVAPPRLLITTPLQLRGLLAADTALPPVKAMISATAPLDGTLAAAAEARWSTSVLEIFGATEVGSIASRRTVDGDLWRLYPGVRLSDGDPTVVSVAGAGDIPLADAVALDGAAGFRLLGRRTDIVKLGGHRASIPGLNRTLAGLRGVTDGVFVVPDDLDSRSNARLIAVVVAHGRTAADILTELRGCLDPLFVPRRVVLADRLPRNELGKLPREALLALLDGMDEAAT